MILRDAAPMQTEGGFPDCRRGDGGADNDDTFDLDFADVEIARSTKKQDSNHTEEPPGMPL